MNKLLNKTNEFLFLGIIKAFKSIHVVKGTQLTARIISLNHNACKFKLLATILEYVSRNANASNVER